MNKNDFVMNGWKLDNVEEMQTAATCMSYQEFLEYKDQQKRQAAEAMRDLKGMYRGSEALYEDTIKNVVGEKFLTLFKKLKMIESCAVIGGRKLYAI